MSIEEVHGGDAGGLGVVVEDVAQLRPLLPVPHTETHTQTSNYNMYVT